MPALSSGEKKFVAIAAIIVVVFVSVVGGTVAALTIGHHKPLPVLQVAHGKSLTHVSPAKYCRKFNGPACVDAVVGPVPRITLPPGESMMISVPHEIADGPWMLFVVRRNDTPDTDNHTLYGPNSRYTVTLTSDPRDPIQSVEIHRVETVTADGFIIPSGVWILQTNPAAA